jgi:hypothetical protein
MSTHNIAGRASADADAGTLIFGPMSASNVSHILQIERDPIVLKGYNLTEGDEVLVEMVDGDGAGTQFAPFCPFNGQALMTFARNVLPIGIPGRYRFILTRADGAPPPVGQVIVRAHAVRMSVEWLTAYIQRMG